MFIPVYPLDVVIFIGMVFGIGGDRAAGVKCFFIYYFCRSKSEKNPEIEARSLLVFLLTKECILTTQNPENIRLPKPYNFFSLTMFRWTRRMQF